MQTDSARIDLLFVLQIIHCSNLTDMENVLADVTLPLTTRYDVVHFLEIFREFIRGLEKTLEEAMDRGEREEIVRLQQDIRKNRRLLNRLEAGEDITQGLDNIVPEP